MRVKLRSNPPVCVYYTCARKNVRKGGKRCLKKLLKKNCATE
nr:MAG TPA: hypothetical protein [Caudoviricetes sp.]